MRWFVSFLLLAMVAMAQEHGPYSASEAYNITSAALLKREDVKLLTKNAENWAIRQAGSIGLSPEFVSPFVMVLGPLAAGKVSLQDTNIRWEPKKDLTVKPKVDYYLNNSQWSSGILFNWNF